MAYFSGRTVQTANIADGSVTTAKLADDAVTTAKIVAGTIINADMNVTSGHNIDFKRKASDESVNNSTTLQNDDDLVSSSLAANTEWSIEACIMHNANTDATGDFKFDFVEPASANFRIGGLMQHTDDTIKNALAEPSVNITFGAATTFRFLQLSGWISIAGTAGTMQLRWAQNVAVATNYTFGNRSWMLLRRLA